MPGNFKNMKIKNITIILILSSLIPFPVFAIGQMTEPIIFNNGLKGEGFRETIFLVNTEENDADIKLLAEGDIAGWVKFYSNSDQTNPIDSINVPGKSQLNLSADFLIPKDAPNGQYKGSISAIKEAENPQGNNENILSVSQKIDREVAIQVSDNELINFSASIIPDKYNLDAEEPLNIRFIYDNQGNVSIEPQIQIKITKDDNIVHNAIYPFPDKTAPVKPLSQYEIPSIDIPTTMLNDGKYLVKIEFSNDGKSYLEKDFSFSVGAQNSGSAAVLGFTRIKEVLLPLYFFLGASALIFIGFLHEKKAKTIKKALKKIY